MTVSLPKLSDFGGTVFLNCRSIWISAVSASGLKEFYCNIKKLLAMKTSHRNELHLFHHICIVCKLTVA
jgi:hypothetical protein